MFLLCMLITAFGFRASAQLTYTGTVVGTEDNQPLIGATVLIKGTNTGVATDIDGTFSIEANVGQTLIFTYTGFATQEYTLSTETNLEVALAPDNLILDEVVVTGYGEQSRSSYTGAAVKAPVDRISQAPRSTLVESLQGNVAGLQVNQGSGQPGAFQNVQIRGLGSINAGTNPLYVIDGIPVINENIGNESTTSTPLAGLNPQDIADIQVLKDASATAIYGSRGANGVIIITTKQGQSGAPRVNLSVQTGINDVSLADELRPLNTAEYLELMREGLINSGDAANEAEANAIINDNIADPSIDTDWFDEITQQGNFTQTNLSVSGGNDKTTFFASGGYQKNDGTIISTDFERLSGRLNLNTEMSDWLNIGVNVSGSHTTQNTVPGGGAFANPVRSIFRFVPVQPVYNPDGSYNLAINAGFNPVGEAIENTDRSMITNLLGSINAEVKLPLDGLTYVPYVSINRIVGQDATFFVPEFGTGASRNGYGESDFDIRNNWIVRNMLKYTAYLNDAHGIDVTLGHEAQKFTEDATQTLQRNFAFPNLTSLDNGSEPEFIGGFRTENRIESYFLNTSYNFKSKYYINGTVRRDGSSRFGADERYGVFWSAGVGVNLDRFDFMTNFPAVTNLRLRASYGENGNEAIGNFASRGLYGTGADYLDSPGIILDQLENAGLTWEVNKPFNVGVELGLWNRVNLIVDVYNRRTSSLLFNRPVSPTNGVTSVTSNIGELENRGVEFQLNTVNVQGRNNGFEWTTSFNISFNKNEVLSLPEGDFPDGSRFRSVGQPWNTWYMRGYAGVDTETGQATWYVDESETEITTEFAEAGLYQQGTSDPDFFGGLSNTFRYKGFSLTTLFNFDWGRQILHTWHRFTHTDGARGFSTTGNLARSIYERRWQQPGDVTDTPQFVFGNNSNSGSRSTRFLYDGSFISLRDVTLSYSFPQSLVSKARLQSARLFVSGSNLWIYVKDDRLERDPRTDAGGVIDQEIPIPRTFTFGLDVSF
jgi:TonB-dependent starch-binding outer membrane protein SusC